MSSLVDSGGKRSFFEGGGEKRREKLNPPQFIHKLRYIKTEKVFGELNFVAFPLCLRLQTRDNNFTLGDFVILDT